MSDLTLLLPSQLNGAGLCQTASMFKHVSDSGTPESVTLDFACLDYVQPCGVTFLSNFAFWLARQGVKVFFSRYDRPGYAIKFLDDSLFFEQHLGRKLHANSSPRATTMPLQRVENEKSHAWLRSDFIPWLSHCIGMNAASLYTVQVSLSEIFNNIQDHADLNVGSIFIQHFPNKKIVNISIADFGCGIPHTVRTTLPELLDDSEAIKQAVQEGFTSRSTPRNRGAGLDYLLQTAVAHNGGTVSIFSLEGYVVFTRGDEGVIARTVRKRGFCPGTTIDIALRTDTIVPVEDESEEFAW